MLVAVRIAAATARGARPNAIHHLFSLGRALVPVFR
jgi:hypothetical protein